MTNKILCTTLYIKSEQFSVKSKGHSLFAEALNFYKLNLPGTLDRQEIKMRR